MKRLATVCLQKRTREVEGGQRPVALPEYTALAPGGLDAALICHVAGEMHLFCTIQKESTILKIQVHSEVCAKFRCTGPVLYNEHIETDFFDVSRAQNFA